MFKKKIICFMCSEKVPKEPFCCKCGTNLVTLIEPAAPIKDHANEPMIPVEDLAIKPVIPVEENFDLILSKYISYKYKSNQNWKTTIESITDINVLSEITDKTDNDDFDRIISIKFIRTDDGESETCGGCTLGDGKDCSTPSHYIDKYAVITANSDKHERHSILSIGFSKGGKNCSNASGDYTTIKHVNYIVDGKEYSESDYYNKLKMIRRLKT